MRPKTFRPQTLRALADAGELPGAEVSGCWPASLSPGRDTNSKTKLHSLI